MKQRVFGIETEYGITVEGAPELDVVAESIALVRTYRDEGAHMKWDYAQEDPHRDVRGFRAKELRQDTDESNYFEADRRRPLSFEEIKSDIVLTNGARFYNDHAHPEYSTPECTTLREIVAHDKAGERIMAECARRRNAELPEGQRVRLYKNNTDFAGHSYGCHDNYLLDRAVPWDRVVAGAVPFLVTRQIFAGAGKVGIETEGGATVNGTFQISQRADFFSVLVSIDTMNQRPLVNTRDEPHADAQKYRRLHVIIGDANMSEWATAMKIGTTAIALELIERGMAPRIEIAQSVEAAKAISRDQDYRWLIELEDGRKISAIEVQRHYLDAAKRLESSEESAWILDEWESVLDDLDRDVTLARDRVDWVAKKLLLEELREAEGLEWDDPWLQAIDLEYHNVDPEAGLYYALERQGTVRRVVTDVEIDAARYAPTETTRAFVRGRAVERFGALIEAVQWEYVTFKDGRKLSRVPLTEPAICEEMRARVEAATDIDSFLRAASTPK